LGRRRHDEQKCHSREGCGEVAVTLHVSLSRRNGLRFEEECTAFPRSHMRFPGIAVHFV
jgi:hypothetical protein